MYGRKVLKHRPEYDLKVIGENLKRLRELNGFSVEDIREYLRLGSVQAVYKYEKGKGYPQADAMFALMELYGVDIADIICKHETNDCSINSEEQNPSLILLGYYISELEVQTEITNIDDYKNNRLKQYADLYMEFIKKDVAS